MTATPPDSAAATPAPAAGDTPSHTPRTLPAGMPVVAMVGGGQLARMTHQAAIALGQTLRVLAASPDEPAARVSPDV
ncbi:MAG: 5-(carboxyamino)imidazole ribonucleotide synthase, partial [Rhodococcus ruber]|nr:5-(carboxyamino)imidazole ribonucleotide synthase [Rhodococcus ruber]